MDIAFLRDEQVFMQTVLDLITSAPSRTFEGPFGEHSYYEGSSIVSSPLLPQQLLAKEIVDGLLTVVHVLT